MEIDHVLELVHHLSERCEFDRTAQLKGLGKVAKAVEKLEWVGEGLDRIEGRLNGSWAAEPSTNDRVHTEFALRHFRGPNTWEYMYTDGAPELLSSLDAMGVSHDQSMPGRSVTNSVAERTNRHVLEGARSLLMHAGFPAQYWPYAVEYFCLMCNVTRFSAT